jgi:hypothetical protein
LVIAETWEADLRRDRGTEYQIDRDRIGETYHVRLLGR